MCHPKQRNFLVTFWNQLWTKCDPLGNKKKKRKKKTDAFLTFNCAFHILFFNCCDLPSPSQKNCILFYILLMKHTKTVQSRSGCVWTAVRAPPSSPLAGRGVRGRSEPARVRLKSWENSVREPLPRPVLQRCERNFTLFRKNKLNRHILRINTRGYDADDKGGQKNVWILFDELNSTSPQMSNRYRNTSHFLHI